MISSSFSGTNTGDNTEVVNFWTTQSNLCRLQVSGGAATQTTGPGSVMIDTSNTAASVSGASWGSSGFTLSPLVVGGDSAFEINFSRSHEIQFMFFANTLPTGTAVAWFGVGAHFNSSFSSTALSAAQPSQKGFGIKLTSAGVRLWDHDGTNYSETAATAIAASTAYDMVLSYASGTLNATINGVAMPTLTGGPSGLSGTTYNTAALVGVTGGTNERIRCGVMRIQSISSTI